MSARMLSLLPALACAWAQAATVSFKVSDGQDAPLGNAVVSVLVRGTPAQAAPGTRAELAQRRRRFVPEVLVVQTGTAVNLPNFDTVRHHVYSFSPIKPFELQLYAGTPAAPVVFDKPGTAVLGCNIHDNMSAYVRVVDTPYFAMTDATGVARLDLPPGDHSLSTWHASLPLEAAAPAQALKVGRESLAVSVRLPAH